MASEDVEYSAHKVIHIKIKKKYLEKKTFYIEIILFKLLLHYFL